MEKDLNCDLASLQLIIDKAMHFNVSLQDEEKDVFSLGGRGHYENPISDLLAFFLNPLEQHKLGDLFLVSLFECMREESKTSFLDVQPPLREEPTNNGKRIDILISAKDWVVVIENKIYHWLANPINDYMDYVDVMDGKKNAVKKKFIVVLALAPEPPEFSLAQLNPGWSKHYISYQNYLESIKRNIGNYLLQACNNKWLVIMREFLLNLERMIRMSEPLEQEKIDFVAKNIPQINSVQNLWNAFQGYLEQSIKEKFPNDSRPSVSRNNWGDGTALRFYGGSNWANGANMTVVVLKETGYYRFGIYLPEMQNADTKKLDDYFNPDKLYEEYWENKNYWRIYWGRKDNDYKELDPMFDEATRIIKLITDYYKS